MTPAEADALIASKAEVSITEVQPQGRVTTFRATILKRTGDILEVQGDGWRGWSDLADIKAHEQPPRNNVDAHGVEEGRRRGELCFVRIDGLEHAGPHPITHDCRTRVWVMLPYGSVPDDRPKWLVQVGDRLSDGSDEWGSTLWSVPADRCWFMSPDDAVAQYEIARIDATMLAAAR